LRVRAHCRVTTQAPRVGRRPWSGRSAGAGLLADLADAPGLGAFADTLRGLRPRGTGHDPGRIAVDAAVLLADGGQAISDLALLRDQPDVFGPASPPPPRPGACRRALRSARAAAREVVLLQAAETAAASLPPAPAGAI
jgi:hypothetical protein